MKLINLKETPFIKFYVITTGSLVSVTGQYTNDLMLLGHEEGN